MQVTQTIPGVVLNPLGQAGVNIQNNTMKTLYSAVVVYEIAEAGGAQTRFIHANEPINVASGASMNDLFPPERLAGKRIISAALDSVTFADGAFVGPDNIKLFDRMVKRDQAPGDFLKALSKEIQKNDPAALRAWLVKTRDDAKSKHGTSPTDTDIAASMTMRRADFALHILDSGGVSQVVKWQQQSLASETGKIQRHKENQ
jgi:hypothetical protein